MRLQAQLGNISYSGRRDLDNQGKLSIGRVVGFNNKTNTADVALITGSTTADGRDEKNISCLRMGNWGYDEERKVAYGSAEPIQKNQIVLIGYVDSMKGKPVILGGLAPPYNDVTNSPRYRAENEIEDERNEEYSVNINQDFSFTNGRGEFDRAHHNGSYCTGRMEKVSDHRENGFSYRDLSLRDKLTMQALRLKEKFFNFKPFNYLFITRNTYEDEKTTVYNRFYHDAEHGVTRVSRDGEHDLFYIELDDGFTIKQQRDSNRRPRGRYEKESYPHETLRLSDKDLIEKTKIDNQEPDYQPINETSEVTIKDDGSLILHVQDRDQASEISIRPDGITITSTGDINIQGKNINFTGERSIQGQAPIAGLADKVYPRVASTRKGDDSREWQRQWIQETKKI